MSDRQFFYCGGKLGEGHIVGETELIKIDGLSKRITVLHLYEESLDSEPEILPPLRIETLIGMARGLCCTKCENKFSWYPGILGWMKMFPEKKA